MRYLLLVYLDDDRLMPCSCSGSGGDVGEAAAVEGSLRESGRLLAIEALHAPETSTTIRIRQGRVELADGPSTSAGNRLTAMCLIRARDLAEAIRIAALLPAARWGSVEVRAVFEATPDAGPLHLSGPD